MREIIIFIRIIVLTFCVFTIGNIGFKFFSVLILLFWGLFEINICFFFETGRRSLNVYKNNIILVLSTVVLLFLNLDKSVKETYYLRKISENIGIDSKKIYFMTLYLLSLVLISLCFINILKKEKKRVKESKLLPYRKEELKKLKNYLVDRDIQTILLDGKIGNGKTELIEDLIQGLEREMYETIYLKLPLIESIDELKKIVAIELKIIFNKYGLDSNYLNNFIGKISTIKTNFFELNMDINKNNIWNNIQVLKENLKELEKKGVRVLIILDDIEREENPEKIKNSICFLGELSEYFRSTTAVVLFLAEYEKILKKLENRDVDLNEFGCDSNLSKIRINEKFDKRLLDKYFGYIMKIGEIELKDLTIDDLKLLMENKINDEKITDSYISFIIELLKKFSLIYEEEKENYCNHQKKDEYPILFSENIRNIKRFLRQGKILSQWSEYNNTCCLIINIVNLFDIFLEPNGKSGEYEQEKIKRKLFDDIMGSYEKVVRYDLVKNEIEKIEKLLKKGKFISEDFIVNIEKVINIIDKKLVTTELIKLNYQETKVILKYIGNNKKRLNIFLENTISIDKNILIDKISKMNLTDTSFLSEKSKEKFKEILLERKLSALEEEMNNRYIDEEYYEEEIRAEIERDMSVNEKIEEAKKTDKKRREIIIDLVEKDNFFANDIKKIKEISDSEFKAELESDKYYLEQERRWRIDKY